MEKPRKILYEDQAKVWEEAKQYLVEMVSGEECVKEAIVWASLAEGKFGVYEKKYGKRGGSDIDLVIVVDEEHFLPRSWKFTTVEKSCFDPYRLGQSEHQGHVHEIDGLLVFPTRHDLSEVREMLAGRSKGIYLKTGARSILG